MRSRRQIAAVTLLIGLMALAWIARDWLTLDRMRSELETFRSWIQLYPNASLIAYFLIYVVVAAIAIPGAAALTMVGGLLFGFTKTLVLVSFASTLGSTMAFLASRYFLNDWVQKIQDPRIQALQKEIAERGSQYLFMVRLNPIFPFFLVNVAAGLTPIKAWTFTWVSQIGMLPGTILFVNAGHQLAEIKTIQEVLSLDVVLAFIALGFVPLILSKLRYRPREK